MRSSYTFVLKPSCSLLIFIVFLHVGAFWCVGLVSCPLVLKIVLLAPLILSLRNAYIRIRLTSHDAIDRLTTQDGVHWLLHSRVGQSIPASLKKVVWMSHGLILMKFSSSKQWVIMSMDALSCVDRCRLKYTLGLSKGHSVTEFDGSVVRL